MRKTRIKVQGGVGVYHVIVRVVGGELLLGDLEKDRLRIMMRENARFAGLQILTYCVMSNHFHLLVRIPEQVQISDRELVRRVNAYYPKKSLYRQLIKQSFEEFGGKLPQDLREGLLARLGDLPLFMKDLKQRFSKWFNKHHGRFGTLWSGRFKSVVVEDQPGALSVIAAYIDLNPIRAGIVEDPKDYRWCGYAEAVAGNREARDGLTAFSEFQNWRSIASGYRKLLYVKSGASGAAGKKALDREAIKRAMASGGELSLAEALRVRIRYFSDGVALGSGDFVDSIFSEFRDQFGEKRKSGARSLQGKSPLGELKSLRDLRVNPYE